MNPVLTMIPAGLQPGKSRAAAPWICILSRLAFACPLFCAVAGLLGAEPLTLAPYAGRPVPAVLDVIHSPVSIGFTVRIEKNDLIPDSPVPLLFCVPLDRPLSVRVVSYRVGGVERIGEVVALADGARTTETVFAEIPGRSAADSPPLLLSRPGIMRRWPLALLRLGDSFYAPVKQDKHARDELRARLEIAWDVPVEPGNPVRFGEPHWRSIGAKLVANPEGLDWFALDEIPICGRIGSVSAWEWTERREQPWIKIRLAEPGPHRIAVEKLDAKIWQGAEWDASRLRLFHRGEEVPLFVREGAGVYFWNPPVESEFDAENVFWLTLDAEDKGARLPIWTPPVGSTERRTTDRTRMESVVDEDKVHRISYGDFRSVRAMRWVAEPLEAGVPVEVVVPFDGEPIEGGGAKADISFYFNLSTMAHSPANTTGVSVTVAQADGTTHTVLFANDLDAVHSISLNPASVHGGGTTLTLTLDQPLAGVELDELWLDWVKVGYQARPVLRSGRLTLVDDDASTETWIARTPILMDEPVDASSLFAVMVDPSGRATATLTLSQDHDGLHLHWPRSPGHRVELREFSSLPVADRFEAVSAGGLLDSASGADMVIITHRDFMKDLGVLAAFRQAQGTRVKMVDVQEIYDAFNFGELSPYAIRDFVAHTLQKWHGGAPESVLLAGDCTSDYQNTSKQPMTREEIEQRVANGTYQNNTGGVVKNWVPTHAYDVKWDKWASDEWMGLVAGEDPMSDVMIGRISANNTTDMRTVVNKILAYETDYPVGPWRARLGFVADNEPEFPSALDEFRAESIPSAFAAVRIYAGELSAEDNFYTSDEDRRETFDLERRWMKISTEATGRMLDLFRQGAATITYFGHGSPNIWSDERIWFGGDSVNSDNLYTADSGRFPFIINFTCNSGAIDYPIPQWNINIIEDMIRTPRGGAIGAFVPSGPGSTWIQKILGRIMFDTLYRDGVRTLGEFSALSRLRHAATGVDSSYVYMYILLGDPNQRLQMTCDTRTFALPRTAYSPGESLKGTVRLGEPLERASFMYEICDARGVTLWTSDPASGTQALAPFDVRLDASWPEGPMSLRLVAWDQARRCDVAAWADFMLLRPDDRIVSAKAWRLGGDETLVESVIANDAPIPSNGLRWGVSAVAPDGSVNPVHEEAVSLRAGERLTLSRRVRTGAEAVGVEIALRRAHQPDDLSRANPELRRLPFPGVLLPPPAPAKLRLVPGSLRIRPESPAEGQTLFASVTVENIGGETSASRGIALYSGDPRTGGEPGYDHNQGTTPKNLVPELGPGRSHEMTLRWDPTFNAGEQTFWIGLAPAAGDPDDDELTSGTVRVRTKFKLSYRNVRVEASREDVENNRMTLHAEVVNEGESEARHVVLGFFRGARTDDAHKIYEEEIPVLAPNSAVPVTHVWNFGSRENLRDSDGVEGFRVQIRIKGSRLRITSPPPGTPDVR